jgi:hypothetical protein
MNVRRKLAYLQPQRDLFVDLTDYLKQVLQPLALSARPLSVRTNAEGAGQFVLGGNTPIFSEKMC